MKFDRATGGREQRVVVPNPDLRARMKFGAALAYDDVAGNDDFATELLHAKSPTAAVAPVAG